MHGIHILADFYGCSDCALLDDAAFLEHAIKAATDAIGTTLLEVRIVQFPGGGVTAFGVLTQSHISLHTSPEFNFIALDIFTCGSCNPRNGLHYLQELLSPQHCDVTEVSRGGFGP